MNNRQNALYKSELAGSVRKRYVELLRQRKPSGEAVNILMGLSSSRLEDAQYSKVFWMALADTMWSYGRLTDQVKNNALSVIAECRRTLLSLREACPQIYNDRTLLLNQLEEKLGTPQPEQKRVAAHQRIVCDWEAGDVLCCRLSSCAGEYAGRRVCVHVIRKQAYGTGHIVPVVRVFRHTFAETPRLEALCKDGYLPQFWGPSAYNRRLDASQPYTVRMFDVLYNMLLSASNVQDYQMFRKVGALPVKELKLDRVMDANESTCRLFELETAASLEKWKDTDIYALMRGL